MVAMHRLLGILFLSLGLTGCAEKYVEPTGPHLATVHIVKNNLDIVGRGVSELVTAIIYKDAVQCIDPQQLGTIPDAGPTGQADITAKLASGKPTSVLLSAGVTRVLNSYEECRVVVSFLPVDGGDYQVRYADDYPKGCRATVLKRDSGGTYLIDSTMVPRATDGPTRFSALTCYPLNVLQKAKLGIQ